MVTLQSRVGIRGISEEISLAKILLLAWWPGQDAPEASAGIRQVMVNSLDFRRRRQEASAPALSTEKSVPHGSKRTGLASRPWAPWAFTANLFSSDLGHPPVTEGLPAQPPPFLKVAFSF